MTLLFCGRPAEAAAGLQRAVELKPDFASALGHLAAALLQVGREDEALLAYRRLSQSADDPILRRFYLAQTLKMEGKLEEAENEVRGLLAMAPQTAKARSLLGELLSSRGMFEEAARHLTEAVEVFPPAFLELTVVKRMTETDRPWWTACVPWPSGLVSTCCRASTFNSALARRTTTLAITRRRCDTTNRQTG